MIFHRLVLAAAAWVCAVAALEAYWICALLALVIVVWLVLDRDPFHELDAVIVDAALAPAPPEAET